MSHAATYPSNYFPRKETHSAHGKRSIKTFLKKTQRRKVQALFVVIVLKYTGTLWVITFGLVREKPSSAIREFEDSLIIGISFIWDITVVTFPNRNVSAVTVLS